MIAEISHNHLHRLGPSPGCEARPSCVPLPWEGRLSKPGLQEAGGSEFFFFTSFLYKETPAQPEASIGEPGSGALTWKVHCDLTALNDANSCSCWPLHLEARDLYL